MSYDDQVAVMEKSTFITARNEVGARLCFHRRV